MINLYWLSEVAVNRGMEVTFQTERKAYPKRGRLTATQQALSLQDGEMPVRGGPVMVTRFTRGVGTEAVAFYRIERTNPDPVHVQLKFVGGFRISNAHPDDWPFVPHNSAVRWARLAGLPPEEIEAQDREDARRSHR